MLIEIDKTGSIKKLDEMLKIVSADSRVESIMILSCDENGFTKQQIDPILTAQTLPVFGGIFPQIIFSRETLKQGTIVAGLFDRAEVRNIPDLSDMNADYEEIIGDNIGDQNAKTMFVFVDGLAKRIGSLIESLFNVYGLEFNYIGGGAGSLSMEQKPCLFSNDGMIADSAVIALVKSESGIGVSHGWIEVEGPFKVTEVDRNIIISLDWKPAIEVYRDVVEKHTNCKLDNNNFFDIAKSYPFGIDRLGAEKIIRDPMMIGPNNSLVCVGEVPQGSFVHIMTGNADSLVKAAKKALTLSEESLEFPPESKTVFFIDCISRVLFLEEKFCRELEAVSDGQTPLIGALTLGEIANNRKDYLEFYNKTSVVGVLTA